MGINIWRGIVLCVGIGLLYVGNTSHSMAPSVLGWLLLILGAPYYIMISGLVVFCLIGFFPEHISMEIGAYVIVGYLWVGTKIVWSVKEAIDERERQERNLRVQEDEERERLERETRERGAEIRERARFRNENKEIFAGISDLLSSCGAPAVEIMRAARAIEGTDIEMDPKAVVWMDVGYILVSFIRTGCTGDAYIKKLWSEVAAKLKSPMVDGVPDLSVIKNRGVKQLAMVLQLAEYDKQQGTTLLSIAASTYLSIVSAVSNHCEGSVAARMVTDAYIGILRPYIHESGRRGYAGNSNASGSHSNRKPVCAKCDKAFDLVGLSLDASPDNVRQKRRTWAEILHPDQLGSKSERARDAAEQQLKTINSACDHILRCRA